MGTFEKVASARWLAHISQRSARHGSTLPLRRCLSVSSRYSSGLFSWMMRATILSVLVWLLLVVEGVLLFLLAGPLLLHSNSP